MTHKIISLIGMSGVGKTHLSLMLAAQGWAHYSCDLEIGTKFLRDDIAAALGEENRITAADLSQLSRYVGQLGEGDLSLAEFKNRQAKYIEAECQSLCALKDVSGENIINDTTGSFCEIEDKALIREIGENSLIVYIKASADEEQEVLKRAAAYPKPMYFPPAKFDTWLAEYANMHDYKSTDEFKGNDFARWVFPKLFEKRLPKYQKIADQYGVTIPSEAFQNVDSAAWFLDIIKEHA